MNDKGVANRSITRGAKAVQESRYKEIPINHKIDIGGPATNIYPTLTMIE